MFSRFTRVLAWISISFLWLNNILLFGCTTFCLSIHELGTFGLFSFFGYYRNVTMNICVCFFVDMCFQFFPYTPRSGIVGSDDNFNLLRTCQTVSRAAALFYFPEQQCRRVPVLCILTRLVFLVFSYSFPSGCKVITHYSLIYISLITKDIWAYFHVLIGHFDIFFGKMSIQILYPFLIGLFQAFSLCF